MSKSGSSAGSKSGAGRKGRVSAGAGERGSRTHKTASQHAELRRNAERVPHGPKATDSEPAKSGNQLRKQAQAARAIAKKKAKKRG